MLKYFTKVQIYTWLVLILSCLASILFVLNNDGFYDRPIVKVLQIHLLEDWEEEDSFGNKDHLYTQELVTVFKNGIHKGKQLVLENTYSLSQAYDEKYHVGDKLFVVLDKKPKKEGGITGGVSELKRDHFLLIAFWIFLLVLYAIGKRQGLLAVVSLAVNIILLAIAIEIFVRTGMNLLVLAGILAILFTVLSLLFVNGWNEKTYAAIIATILGTFSSLAITLLVMKITNENGMRYEEMQFLTRPYKVVFIAGLFIGSLGAVMDVAITMSSSIFELWEKDNKISISALKKSGLDIGKDIMGTMTSILFFAYISGSIPMLILYLKNYSPLDFTLSLNLSLELVRALAGGIGIVLTIPIGLYTSIFFVKRKKVRA